MKAVILAGGLGTRLGEETSLRPKPMVRIGGMPILWHIMKIYSFYGIDDFIICLGYKGYAIKEYFANYFLHMSDLTINLKDNSMEIHHANAEPWKVTLLETGKNTMTGGRLKRVASYLDEEDFCFTYGDGLGDINIRDLVSFHKSKKRMATVTAVRPPGRFGSLSIIDENRVDKFIEKPLGDGGWINAGFFVLSPKVIDYIDSDSTSWEQEPLKGLAEDSQLSAYLHEGFWQPMDTLRDKNLLEELWENDNTPWKVWP
jgi:glucose-1-phosphate cytidylyltransferase